MRSQMERVMDAFVDSKAIQKWIELGKTHGISVMGLAWITIIRSR